MVSSASRHDTMEAFLDAAERLLITEGYAGVSVRRLAEEAGANHGLVHYYFGSMEELFLRVLERFTDRLTDPSASDVCGGRAVHREVAHRRCATSMRTSSRATRRSGSSSRRWRGTTPRSASASRASTPNGARCSPRRSRGAMDELRIGPSPFPGAGDRVAGVHVQPGDHAGTPVRGLGRASRAARRDRRRVWRRSRHGRAAAR